MPLERPRAPETLESLTAKAQAIAVGMSQKWMQLSQKNPVWQAEYPELAHIWGLNAAEKGGRTGIQRHFETAMANTQQDKQVTIRRLIADLERYRDELESVLNVY